MQVIPVIDLFGGQVVRAVGGRRSEYRPVESCLAADAQPATIARAFVERFGFDTAYVADLDAIAGAEPVWSAYEAIAACGLKLWVDAGVGDSQRAEQMADFRTGHGMLDRVIVGGESIAGPGSIDKLLRFIGRERMVFSLDMLGGKLIGPAWKQYTPLDAARAAIDAGVQQIIVLDLGHVGMENGVSNIVVSLRIEQIDRSVRLITGGGIRSIADLELMTAMRVDAVLVASALHNGQLTSDDLRAFQQWFRTVTQR
jgi:phosphoribosylformimino-5-aminoimidazole carboxamide ribotide isomerase